MAHAAGEPRGGGAPREVAATAPFARSVRAPGSKSMTNRALFLAALAQGTTEIAHALRSEDTDALARAIAALGVPAEAAADRFTVSGRGGALPAGGEARIDLGDGGTPTRFALALAALAPRVTVVDGSARMRQRPVADGVALLRALGADLRWDEAEGRLPVRVDGRAGAPAGGTLRVGTVASSQFVSAVMLAACRMRDGLELAFDGPPTSASYLDLTIDELRAWNVPVDPVRGPGGALASVRVRPSVPSAGGARAIEPDASSALYWAAAAALVPGSAVTLAGLPRASTQPDMRAIEVIAAMGATLTAGADGVRVAAARPAGDPAPPLAGVRVDCAACPDGALMLAALAAAADGPSRLEGLGTLRVKESDRLAAMAEGLARAGARAEFGADWIEVTPIPRGHRVDAEIDPHGDHRIAMSFAVLGLRTGGIRVRDPGCVAKSYPGFWAELERVREAPGAPIA
jgi:3-phosphoshikimate 1-carboxyvinyltransferase